MRHLIILTAVATLVASVTPSLQAQGNGRGNNGNGSGNRSDVGGVKPGNGNNGSGSNGNGTGQNNGNNGAPGTPGNPNRIVFGEALSVGAAPAAPGVTVLSLAPVAQKAGSQAARLTADVGSAAAPSAALVDALLQGDGAPTAAQVERFARSYAGMLNAPSRARIAAATTAFNAMVQGASAAYLTKPPAEFVATQAVLTALVAQTSRR